MENGYDDRTAEMQHGNVLEIKRKKTQKHDSRFGLMHFMFCNIREKYVPTPSEGTSPPSLKPNYTKAVRNDTFQVWKAVR